MKKKPARPIYYGDTETTQEDPVFGVRVYLWCVIGETDAEYCGYDIETLFKLLARKRAIFYFHNLKFDWSYMEYYALKHKINFRILERKGVIFSVKFGKCELRDSLNLINCSLKEIGENYCTNYKKTSIDYEAADYLHDATAEEVAYCFNDCYVLREGLNTWKHNLKELLLRTGATNAALCIDKKLTAAGIAFEAFKELSDYDNACPKTTIDEYNGLVGAYHGGYVYSRPCGVCRNVIMMDCNSIYPFVYATKNLPYGYGHYSHDINELKQHEFYIVNIDISFELKAGYIPIIGDGFGKYGGTNYQASSNGEIINITVCSYDLELIEEFYICCYEVKYGYYWRTTNGFYKRYCDIFMQEKKNAKTPVVRTLAKIMLNSPYGKTAMNGLSEKKRYFIGSDDVATSEIVGYEMNEETYQYLPQAISITAQARKYLLTTAQKIGFDKVVYMDTDSIKFVSADGHELNEIWVDNKELGAWKDEGHPLYFKTIAPKKYIKYQDGKLDITCAGFNKKALTQQLFHGCQISRQKARVLVDKFDKGLKIECLQSVKVRGGRALRKVWKEIL